MTARSSKYALDGRAGAPPLRTYTVHTREYVAGTYTVEADSREAAERAFSGPEEIRTALEDGTVQQTDYMAYGCEIQSVEEEVL